MKAMIASLLIDELERANRLHGINFTSPHEGYAVLLEELDEFWDEVKKKHPSKDRMHEEAIQVGAMVMKFIMSMNSWTSIDVCRRCLFVVMTAAERHEQESDPCETCNSDLCNWRQAEDKKTDIRR